MTEKEKSADTSPNTLEKTEGKVIENQPKKQESRFIFQFSDFIAYGGEIMNGSCHEQGQGHSRIEQDTEAKLTWYVFRWLAGEDRDAIGNYVFRLTNKSLMVWNDLFYEEVDTEMFSVILRKIFEEAEIGLVYRYRSAERIASAIPASLKYSRRNWTPQPGYITFSNGILEVATGKMIDPNPDIFSSHVILRNYDPSADCPKFKKAVADALDKDTAKVFQEACGNLFLGFEHEIITILVGDGLNGKSTVCNAIAYALGGRDNVSELTLKQITDEQGQHRANMIGKIANICPDSGDLDVGNEDNLKRYCSGESM